MSSFSSDSEFEEDLHQQSPKKLKIDSQNQLTATAVIEVQFKTNRLAVIAFNSLSVDKGPRGENKELTVMNDKLIAKFKSVDSKNLRKSINSFLDFTNLVIKTIERFDTIC